MSKVLSQNEGPSTACAANYPILAPTALGHRYCRQGDPRIGQLYLRNGGGGILYKMDRGEVAHQRKLHLNQKILPAKY
jgi:hypothetical protein